MLCKRILQKMPNCIQYNPKLFSTGDLLISALQWLNCFPPSNPAFHHPRYDKQLRAAAHVAITALLMSAMRMPLQSRPAALAQLPSWVAARMHTMQSHVHGQAFLMDIPHAHIKDSKERVLALWPLHSMPHLQVLQPIYHLHVVNLVAHLQQDAHKI
jgi:hypothetical protein